MVLLTGEASEHLGEQAVRAGAQDYLVKGEVTGRMLNRVIRYAVERRHAAEVQQALHAAQIHSQENARLERGLLPKPLLADRRLSVYARCVPGGKQHLLGGDFYDVVESSDGSGSCADRRCLRSRTGRSRARRLPAGGVAHPGAGRAAAQRDLVRAQPAP